MHLVLFCLIPCLLLHEFLHQCGPTPAFQMKVHFAFHLEINIWTLGGERGGTESMVRQGILEHWSPNSGPRAGTRPWVMWYLAAGLFFICLVFVLKASFFDWSFAIF